MQPTLNAESYSLVEKYAYKFAYSKTSHKYEEYVNVGLDGLLKAINTFKEDKGAEFKTYAITCITNAMKTKNKSLKRIDLTQDENVVIDNLDTLCEEMAEDDMAEVAKFYILKANNKNERNAEMFMLHIGLTCESPMDYKELSAKFNVSAERVRQVCVNTAKTLRKDTKAIEALYAFV